MTEEISNQKLSILVDMKKPRIRISRETLHALQDPERILLLVNPESQTLIIQVCDKPDPRAHKVRWEKLNNSRNSYELYSTSLIRQLRVLCPAWKENESYRGIGKLDGKLKMVLFQTSEMQNIAGQK